MKVFNQLKELVDGKSNDVDRGENSDKSNRQPAPFILLLKVNVISSELDHRNCDSLNHHFVIKLQDVVLKPSMGQKVSVVN